MSSRQAGRELHRNVERTAPGHGEPHLIEALPMYEFRDEIGPAVDDANAVDGYDVRVLHTGDRPRLDQKALAHRFTRTGVRDELYRHFATEDPVESLVNLAHCTAAEGTQDFILVDLSRRWGGSRKRWCRNAMTDIRRYGHHRNYQSVGIFAKTSRNVSYAIKRPCFEELFALCEPNMHTPPRAPKRLPVTAQSMVSIPLPRTPSMRKLIQICQMSGSV